jgi:catechol-2,3-dioxygenase
MSNRVRPTGIGHIVLRSRKYEEMISWWCTFLGGEVRMRTDYMAFLQFDKEHHRLAIVGFPHFAEPVADAIGVDHFAFNFANLDDLFAKYDEMCALNCAPYWTINHGMTLSAYYRDPDGNQVETQVDTMSPENADAFMKTAAFAQNPIGINVDFPTLIARYRNGVPAEEILDYALAGK